ncbi:MAG: hypothetical protein LBI72_07430 [Flavobacteriaceae bacterium]|jgi:hypothetical protein|nr:hypothetical protein [Flavobacteriaceae bacterium]
MKKLLALFAIIIGGIVITSCEGPQGPSGYPGPPGPSGPSGNGQLPKVFEYKVTFKENTNSDGVVIKHPVEVMKGDMVMIYFLEKVDNSFPIWSPLPYIANPTIASGKQEQIRYIFNYGPFDFEIGAISNIALGNFASTNQGTFTRGLTYRVYYIPAADPIMRSNSLSSESKTSSISMSHDEFVKKYNLQNTEVKKMY